MSNVQLAWNFMFPIT